jgi:nicotinamide riboside kinase
MLAEENKEVQNAKEFLFCDTDLIMMKAWYEVKYDKCHPFVLKSLSLKPYNYYLLCSPDLPWEADPLRENPNMREELFEKYRKELEDYEFNYSVITGTEGRLEKAIEILERIKKGE